MKPAACCTWPLMTVCTPSGRSRWGSGSARGRRSGLAGMPLTSRLACYASSARCSASTARLRLDEPKTDRVEADGPAARRVRGCVAHGTGSAKRTSARLSDHWVSTWTWSSLHNSARRSTPEMLTAGSTSYASELVLRRIRPHDLRHTCASLLLAQGVPARVVMDILGHSQIAVTMDIYSHVLPAMQDDAAERMQRALTRTDSISPRTCPASRPHIPCVFAVPHGRPLRQRRAL